jgi:hypothetical protein
VKRAKKTAASTRAALPAKGTKAVPELRARYPKYWSEKEKEKHNCEVEPAIKRGSGIEAFSADSGPSLSLESYLTKHWRSDKGVAVWRHGRPGPREYLTGYDEYNVTPDFKAQVQRRNTAMAKTPEEFEKFYAMDGARELEDSVRVANGLTETPLLALHILRQSKSTRSGTGFEDHRDDEEEDRKVRSPPSIPMQHTLHLLSIRGTPKRHSASVGVPVCLLAENICHRQADGRNGREPDHCALCPERLHVRQLTRGWRNLQVQTGAQIRPHLAEADRVQGGLFFRVTVIIITTFTLVRETTNRSVCKGRSGVRGTPTLHAQAGSFGAHRNPTF